MAVLLFGFTMAAPAAQDARADAERLARAGARGEALKRFQALAAENPGDIAARLWIARLHLEMHHPERAAAVYESIVATDARHVDALIGLGLALTQSGRFSDAGDALNRAEALAADRVDVLAAQGGLHAADGRTTLALAYYGRALAIEPSHQAARAASDAIRASRGHRVELDYDFQNFNTFQPDTHTGTVEANFRVNDVIRVFGKAQAHEGVFDTEARGGGGFEWRAHHKVLLRAGTLFGNDTRDLPSVDAFADATVRQGRVTWTLDARFVEFEEADLWIGGPGIAIALRNGVTAFGSYHRGRTRFLFGDSSTSDNVTLGVSGRLARRVWAFVEYRHGIDRLDWITLDRVDADDADTLAFGAMTDLTPFVTLAGSYDYQARPEDVLVQRARARLVFRF
ncbi:MAG TPA: tetratricopeptide repeat protein [Gemmatimonadaceae bacterium]|nr:tetratricopeptide repeat protein [Gemmatimonadaceae bacterium]